MEGATEADHVAAARDLSGELERGFDGVGACRAGKLNPVFEPSGTQDELVERGEELALGDREHVQRMDDAIGAQILEQ